MRPYFFAVFSLFAAAAGLAQNVCESQARWTPTQIATPLSVTTSDVAVASDGTAFVAGTFQTATTTSGANVLARWTGAEWDLVPGSPANIQGVVKDPVAGVIVWGNFTSAGDVPVSYVARWNGQVWSAVGSGLTAGPFSVHTGSSVVIALTASGIMRLTAAGWTPLPTSTISFVQAIAVGPQDSVVAAGAAGGQFTPTVARFNGTTWNELPGFGSVLTGSIGSFNSVGVTSDGNVYASWEFAFLTPASATIGYWNGNTWSYRSATPVREFVPMISGQMASISSGSTVNGALVNIGYYWSTSRLTQGVAESLSFNEFVYAPGAPTPPFSLNGIAQLPDGRLMVAGNIPAIGGAATDDVAVFGTSWDAAIDPGSAVNGTVHDFLRLSPSSTLVVGAFSSAGARTTRNIATWNGTTLIRENDAPPLESARCVIMSPASNPVVGGVGSDTYTRVGGAWTRMGSGDLSIYNGSGGSRNGTVYALAYRQDGTLVAAGDFGYGAPPFGGGRNFGNVAQLLAGQWSFMAQGVPYTVYSLLRLPSGDILAGGAEVRRWNGTAWSSFATLAPAGSSVRVMKLLNNGDLVVGGNFTAINGVAARSIARWNGTTWTAYGAGIPSSASLTPPPGVLSIVERPSGRLLVAGKFTSAESRNHVAEWNGSVWLPVDGGVNDSGVVYALHVTTTGDVLAGGSFDRAGSAIARNFSVLDAPEVCACDSIDFNRNGVFPEDQDIVDFFFVFGGGTCSACADIDFNNNNVLPESQDVIDFLHVFAGGNCP